jgi:hsp70-interacting protein
MQSLLRWGIENSGNDDSTTGVAPQTQRTHLDPGIIDAILGRPDSELMKEALAKAQDTSLDEDARLTALEDLEMVNQFLVHPLSELLFCLSFGLF